MRVFTKRNAIRILMTSALIYFIVQGCVLVLKVNEKLYPQVKQMAVIEASNAASMVIKKAVSTIELHPDECMELTRDETGDIIEINYNTTRMNQIMSDCLGAAQSSLDAASSGKMDPNTHMIYYDGGIIYSVHAGYFTGIALLSQVGPQIDVHMKIVSACSGELQVKSTPYGINCTLLEIDLVITTQLLVLTPFLMTQTPVECRIPLVIQIVQGKIPDYIIN